MKIKMVTLENYGSFQGPHTCVLEKRGLVFVGGLNKDEPRMNANGAGKSTLFESIEWCLFGEVPKEDTVDSIVNDQVLKGTKVLVLLEDDKGNQASVERFRKCGGKPDSGVRFTIGNDSLTTLDTNETQKRIDSFLGLDREVFRHAVFFAQTPQQAFADATDSGRKEILTRVLGLGVIDTWQGRAKAFLQDLVNKRTDLQVKLTILGNELTELKGRNYSAEAHQWQVDFEKRVAGVEGLIADKRVAWQSLSQSGSAKKVTVLSEKLKQLNFPSPVPPDAQEVVKQLEATKQIRDARQKALNEHQFELQGMQTKLQAIQGMTTGPCPECGQMITAEHLAACVAKLQQACAAKDFSGPALVLEVSKAQHEVDTFQQKQNALAGEYQKAEQARMHSLGGAQAEMKQATESQTKQKLLEREAVLYKSQLEELKKEVNPWIKKQQDAMASIALKDQQLLEGQAEYEKLEYNRKHLEFWVHGFGPKGLKSHVLDARLVDLNTAANEYVRRLSGGTIWVRFETQTEKKGGGLSEKINVRIFRYNPDGTITERNFKSWSGGERERVAKGIDLGLASLVASRATQTYDLLILDEAFKGLDRKGREAVVEVLQWLMQGKSSVFVIEHDIEMAGLFEHRMVVQKENGQSNIIYEMNPGAPSAMAPA